MSNSRWLNKGDLVTSHFVEGAIGLVVGFPDKDNPSLYKIDWLLDPTKNMNLKMSKLFPIYGLKKIEGDCSK